jgi:hypothetical protein
MTREFIDFGPLDDLPEFVTVLTNRMVTNPVTGPQIEKLFRSSTFSKDLVFQEDGHGSVFWVIRKAARLGSLAAVVGRHYIVIFDEPENADFVVDLVSHLGPALPTLIGLWVQRNQS